MSLIEIAIVLEIVIVNMITIESCCKKKYTDYINLLIMAVFSIVVFYVGYIFISRFTIYGSGNGLFVLLGFLYLIPLNFLYEEKISQLFTIICMAWIYTLGVFALSVQIGKLLNSEYFYLNILIIETALFVASIVPFNRFIVRRYVYILENAKKKKNKWDVYLVFAGTMQFFTMLGMNIVFSTEEGSAVKVIVIFLLVAAMLFTYLIFYEMIKSGNKVEILDETVHRDELTGLRNRLSLYDDLKVILQTDKIFSVLFMDLDCFKQINDQHGHITGDRYLKHFAEVSTSIIGKKGSVYRFGGDEFVAICEGAVSNDFVKKLEECTEWDANAPCIFNKVSIGVEIYRPPHTDIEKLLDQVDRLMYKKKFEKNK